ncbi:MAG: hypothetical protein ACXABY_26115 [Candidatus Thorarchaeota archaeon]|jgi:hypothetical protein
MANRGAKARAKREAKRLGWYATLMRKIRKAALQSKCGVAQAERSQTTWSMTAYEATANGYIRNPRFNESWTTILELPSNKIRTLMKKSWFPKRAYDSPLEQLALAMEDELDD